MILQDVINHFRAQDGMISIQENRVAARTDGSLQIFIHDSTTNEQIPWTRQYYVLALEVPPARYMKLNKYRQSDTFEKPAKINRRKSTKSQISIIQFLPGKFSRKC